MRALIQSMFPCSVVQWAEADDEGGELFSAILHGRLIVANSPALLISALQEVEPLGFVLGLAA